MLDIDTGGRAMRLERQQFSITLLLVLVGVAAIGIASWNISSRARALKEDQAAFNRFKTAMLSNDERFRTLRALDFDAVEQRKAVGLLQKHWEKLEYKPAASLWPTIEGQRYYVGIFHASADAYPEGPNVTIAVLWKDGETVVDALTIASPTDNALHEVVTEIDTDGTFVISIYPYHATGSQSAESTWVATSSGFVISSERDALQAMQATIAKLRAAGELPSTPD